MNQHLILSALIAISSVCRAGELINPPDSVPYYIVVDSETVVQRSFLFYEQHLLPYSISVGSPSKTHYSINSFNGSLIIGWEGKFLNANLMWVHKARGIGVAQPVGKQILFGNEKTYASPDNFENIWSVSISVSDDLQFLGYNLDKTNAPIFRYTFNGHEIEDQVIPSEHQLNRIIHSKKDADIIIRLASGTVIKKMNDGEYLVDGIFRVKTNDKNLFIQQNGTRQLLLTRFNKSLNYTLSW